MGRSKFMFLSMTMLALCIVLENALIFFFSFVICIMRVKKHGLTHYYQLKKKARHLVPCLFFGVFDS